MKYYIKFLWVAVFCGILCVFGGMKNNISVNLSDIILCLGFNMIDYTFNAIPAITYWYMPLLLFQIFYGTYIYQRFCSASVYFFSRNCNRTGWFLKEAGKLYLFALSYLILLAGSGALVTGIFVPLTLDWEAVPLMLYYLAIHSLFLFATTLGINILAVVLTSNGGFILIEGICILGIAAFAFLDRVFQEEYIIRNFWLVKINPFSHLVFSMHSSCIPIVNDRINAKGISFDLNVSVLLYLLIAAVVIGAGCIIVNRREFIASNNETEG